MLARSRSSISTDQDCVSSPRILANAIYSLAARIRRLPVICTSVAKSYTNVSNASYCTEGNSHTRGSDNDYKRATLPVTIINHRWKRERGFGIAHRKRNKSCETEFQTIHDKPVTCSLLAAAFHLKILSSFFSDPIVSHFGLMNPR